MVQMTAASLVPALYLVATPIGAARDITLRALDILRDADVIAAEDTRTLRKLLDIYRISTKDRMVLPYHDHTGAGTRQKLVEAVQNGRSVALVSEAGTPLVSDPGYNLVRDVADAGLHVYAAPGPSALLAALCVSGLPTDRFLFAGFPPAKAAARTRWLEDLAHARTTAVLYESPRRIEATLDALVSICGPDRKAAMCRELTKRFEETLRGTLAELAAQIAGRDSLKGEVVLVLGSGGPSRTDHGNMDRLISAALDRLSLKDAVAEVTQATGLSRRDVYQRALDLAKD
ncbi:MAG: 16S rRNA (cytidine(1402)-2'-O)-methyltransferase [Rhodobacteraceae bacterium]|nr:16S rRNA (cytidine(1402)-2'-O)-methyltransferase [Paracoccaceae bacterium]